MSRLFTALAFTVLGLVSLEVAAQETPATQDEATAIDPGTCGAAGRACMSPAEHIWMAIGNQIADLSSVDLAIYAATCAARPDLRHECLSDPYLVLYRAGIAVH